MRILDLLATNPNNILNLSIQQVVAICGDGILAEQNACSAELREFLRQVTSEKLSEYAEFSFTHGFTNSGFVLQDVINEMGRRLDYNVVNGRYRGGHGHIGFDGIWRDSSRGHDIVVEVKTTDAYQIRLDMIADYRTRLEAAKKIGMSSSILIVVGRQDTGGLEAQVRGSRHAWDIRLISVNALQKLLRIKEDTEEDTVVRIHDLLRPFEYTRIDQIIDIAFTALEELEADTTNLTEAEEAVTVDSPVSATGAHITPIENEKALDGNRQQKTDTATIQRFREAAIAALARRHGTALIRRTRATYWSPDSKTRCACTFSKRYRSTRPQVRAGYWFGYRQAWDVFLSEGDSGFYLLGCEGLDTAIAIPYHWIHERKDKLPVTQGPPPFWHVYLEEHEDGRFAIVISETSSRDYVDEFLIDL